MVPVQTPSTSFGSQIAFCSSVPWVMIAAIITHGTDEQKALWLPKLVEGVWTG
ncbi:MAG: acyl-CoA dehydrogenase family protein, partial [Mesorhizobium sp.]